MKILHHFQTGHDLFLKDFSRLSRVIDAGRLKMILSNLEAIEMEEGRIQFILQ